MNQTLFTILLPIHRPPIFLPLAVDTVLAQTVSDFELFIICDGAPYETTDYARHLEQQDSRIKAFVNSKGERHGEAWRHAALQQARGKYVAHINDDDLWFPNHLAEMEALLHEVDFGNLLHVIVNRSGQPRCIFGDLRDGELRHLMLTSGYNTFGPTVAGYRMAAYRRFPVAWSPAPPDVCSDLYMWRKFLSTPGCICSTRFAITSLHFPDEDWLCTPREEKRAETSRWRDRVADTAARDALIQAIFRQLHAEHVAGVKGIQSQLDALYKSKFWRIIGPLRWLRKMLKQKIHCWFVYWRRAGKLAVRKTR